MNNVPDKAVEAAATAMFQAMGGKLSALDFEGSPLWKQYLPEARAALTAALPHLPGWEDISSAPKDGTEFLAYGSYLYPGDKAVTEYTEIVQFSGDDAWPWSNGQEKAKPGVYSHWRPLPPPPKDMVDATTPMERNDG